MTCSTSLCFAGLSGCSPLLKVGAMLDRLLKEVGRKEAVGRDTQWRVGLMVQIIKGQGAVASDDRFVVLMQKGTQPEDNNICSTK